VKRRYEHWAKVRHPQKKTRKLTEKLQEESKPPTFAFAVARREFELDSKHPVRALGEGKTPAKEDKETD
jgi:hypothetical protein